MGLNVAEKRKNDLRETKIHGSRERKQESSRTFDRFGFDQIYEMFKFNQMNLKYLGGLEGYDDLVL